MIIYIAGPFRGATPWDVERNVRIAEEASLEVARAGHVPLCPHTMYRHFDKSLPDAFWLDATLALLTRCDAILMVGAWRDSKGAVAELRAARARGLREYELNRQWGHASNALVFDASVELYHVDLP